MVGLRPRSGRLQGRAPPAGRGSSGRKRSARLEPGRRSGGEGGIRTLEAGISPPNALAGRRLQPLGHFSGCRERISAGSRQSWMRAIRSSRFSDLDLDARRAGPRSRRRAGRAPCRRPRRRSRRVADRGHDPGAARRRPAAADAGRISPARVSVSSDDGLDDDELVERLERDVRCADPATPSITSTVRPERYRPRQASLPLQPAGVDDALQELLRARLLARRAEDLLGRPLLEDHARRRGSRRGGRRRARSPSRASRSASSCPPAASSRMTSSTSATSSGSSALVTSSSSSSSRLHRERADDRDALLLAAREPVRDTRRACRRARSARAARRRVASASARDRPSAFRGPSVTFSSTDMCGKRLKDWKTIPIPRRTRLTSTPRRGDLLAARRRCGRRRSARAG